MFTRALAVGSILLVIAPAVAAAQQVDSTVCDTVRLPGLVRRVRSDGALAYPFSDSSSSALRPRRNEVLAPAGAPRANSATRLVRGPDGRLRRVRKDAVLKDQAHIRVVKDSTRRIACMPAAVGPRLATGEVAPVTPVPLPPVISTDMAPGLPGMVQPIGRGGWLSAPPIFGGLLLGGAAIALGHHRGGGNGPGGGTDTTIVKPPVTPPDTTPGTPPVTPPDTTPGTPPVTPPDTTPGTPPVTPPGTTVPEPATVALVGLGIVGLAGARRRAR